MRLLVFDSLVSTSDYLKAFKNPEPFLGVMAYDQTRGRGRLGRVWHASPGESFLFSCVLPEGKNPFQTGFAAAHAAVSALKKFSPETVIQIKWPNDLYCGGKKLGGILCEKQGAKVIMGIGINLNQTAFLPEIESQAVSFFQVSGKKISLREFAGMYFKFLDKAYQALEANPEVFLKTCIAPKLAWKGERVRVEFEGSNIPIEGVLEGIDSLGFLMLQSPDGLKTIHTGELKLWLQPSI